MVFPGKKKWVPESVYATVLTIKVTEFIGFWYSHLTNFDGSVSLQLQPSMFSYYEAKTYRKILPLKIDISSRNYGQVHQSTSKVLFMLGDGEIE